MLTYIVFTFLLKLSAVKSDVDFKMMCKNDYKHMNNTPIDVSTFCSSNTCIEKCCGDGEMFSPRGQMCTNTMEMFQRYKKVSKLISDVDYSKIVLWNEGVTKQSKKDFIFVKNQRDVGTCTVEHMITNDFFILEDGAVRMQDTDGPKLWFVIKRLEYCIDFKLTILNRRPQVILVLREVVYSPSVFERPVLWIYMLVGMLVSSFFLVVVLVVYCVLPELQNLTGLVLIAYTLSTLVTSLANIVVLLTKESLTTKLCQIITPMIYFTTVSSVFWMNVMSFDVWWLLRGHRKRCDMNRQSERVKFMWYCLYAWGIPLLMTAIFTTLDYIDLSSLPIFKPNFDDCFFYMKGVGFYYDIPIGLIISVNIILFSLTIYKIWKTKRAVQKISQDSRSNVQDTNRFATYMKLSVVMGVSLFLDLITTDSLWLYIVYIFATTYNRLIGVFLFFLFVFNKRIFFMLCKRFNVKI